jgi:hypothetical protein
VATTLSIIAISLSTLTLLWTIGWSVYTHRQSTRPSVIVLGRAERFYPGRAPPGVPVDVLPRLMVDVTVANTGQVPVTISSVAFEIDGQRETLPVWEWMTQSPHPLPTPLAPGGYWTGLVESGRLTDWLVERYGQRTPRKIRPVVETPAGGRYRAEEWINVY